MIKLQYKQVNNKQIALYTRTEKQGTQLINIINIEPNKDILGTVLNYLNKTDVIYEMVGTEIFL